MLCGDLNGKEIQKGRDICIRITYSLCCTQKLTQHCKATLIKKRWLLMAMYLLPFCSLFSGGFFLVLLFSFLLLVSSLVVWFFFFLVLSLGYFLFVFYVSIIGFGFMVTITFTCISLYIYTYLFKADGHLSLNIFISSIVSTPRFMLLMLYFTSFFACIP